MRLHTYIAEDAVGGRQGFVIVPARQVQARFARCSQCVCPHGTDTHASGVHEHQPWNHAGNTSAYLAMHT